MTTQDTVIHSYRYVYEDRNGKPGYWNEFIAKRDIHLFAFIDPNGYRIGDPILMNYEKAVLFRSENCGRQMAPEEVTPAIV